MASQKKEKSTKKPKRSYKARKKYPFELPSEYDLLDDYLQTHKTELTQMTLNRIEYAMKNELDSIELFKFSDSDFVVTLKEDDFYDNVKNICNFYMESEKYELCSYAFKIKNNVEKKYVK
jgi:hypothetical protein